MLKSTSMNIKPLIPHSSKPREMLKPMVLSTLKDNQRLPLLSELEVSESLPQSQRKSCNSSDWDNCTTLFSSSLTKLPGTWSKWSNHGLHTVILQDKLSANWSTREVPVKSKEEDFLLLIIALLLVNLVNTVLHALKILFMKLSLADQNSRKLTISCGHSNLTHHLADLRSKDTHLLKVTVPSEIEKNSSTPLSRKCCEAPKLGNELGADLQTTNEEMYDLRHLLCEIKRRRTPAALVSSFV